MIVDTSVKCLENLFSEWSTRSLPAC